MICVCGHERDRHLGGYGLCGSSMGGDGPPMLCQCECFEEGVTPTVQPVYSEPSVRPIPQTPDVVIAGLGPGEIVFELQRIHREIEDAIDREVWWMQAMVWTTVLIVPLFITAPAVWWWHSKVRRLQAARDRMMAAMEKS